MPAEVVVGIETDRGPWVQALIAAGYQVYAINPLQVARYRERHSVSGAKSDDGDAHALADMVRIDRAPAAAGRRRQSEQAEAVKVVARAHQTLIWERTRTLPAAAAPRCGSTSPPRWTPSRTWPDRTDALELLGKAPTPALGGAADDAPRSPPRSSAPAAATSRAKAAAIQAALRERAAGPARGRSPPPTRPSVQRPGRGPDTLSTSRSAALEGQVEAHFGAAPGR